MRLKVVIFLSAITLMTSCTGASIEETTTSTTENLTELAIEETTTSTTENLTELAIEKFQSNLTRYDTRNIPDKEELGVILRRNEVFGQLTHGNPVFVESKICDEFTISDLLATSPRANRRTDDELYQDVTTLASEEYPDVFYTITLSILADVDTNQVKNNATRLADIFFLAPDKRCTGRVGVGIDIGFGFPRTTNFTTGYFPDDFKETVGVEIFNYVQGGDGNWRFARTVSLMILEPAKSAIAVVVTAFNSRSSTSSVTRDDMLLEIGQIGYEIKKLWVTKIESDPDWLTILG